MHTSTLGRRVASGGIELNSTSASVIVAVSCPPPPPPPPNTVVWLDCIDEENEAAPPAMLFLPQDAMFIPLPTEPLDDEQNISLKF